MALGSMSFNEARANASKLRDASNSLTSIFGSLRTEMNSLEDVLRSNSADELFKTYKVLEGKLENYPSKITEFENFLSLAVSTYEEDDAKLKNEI